MFVWSLDCLYPKPCKLINICLHPQEGLLFSNVFLFVLRLNPAMKASKKRVLPSKSLYTAAKSIVSSAEPLVFSAEHGRMATVGR